MKKILLEITEDTHRDFKLACVTNGQSLKDALIELIHYYIDSEPKLKQDDKS